MITLTTVTLICALMVTVAETSATVMPGGAGNSNIEVNCVSVNWQGMMCEWSVADLNREDWRLHWSIIPNEGTYLCPNQTSWDTCFWPELGEEDSFKKGMKYYVQVVGVADEDENHVKSSVYQIDTKKIVRPNEVEDVRLDQDLAAQTLVVNWEPPSQLNTQLVELKYRVRAVPADIAIAIANPSVKKEVVTGETSAILSHLTRGVMYEGTIEAKPQHAGFWGPPATFQFTA